MSNGTCLRWKGKKKGTKNVSFLSSIYFLILGCLLSCGLQGKKRKEIARKEIASVTFPFITTLLHILFWEDIWNKVAWKSRFKRDGGTVYSILGCSMQMVVSLCLNKWDENASHLFAFLYNGKTIFIWFLFIQIHYYKIPFLKWKLRNQLC